MASLWQVYGKFMQVYGSYDYSYFFMVLDVITMVDMVGKLWYDYVINMVVGCIWLW